MNYQEIINEIFTTVKSDENIGEVASYIPELSNVDPGKFGVHLTTIENEHFSQGDSDEKFSIQSIAKVLSLTLAYKIEGTKIWKRVGVEPSGSPFNSLIQLEYDAGIPRNPMINAGAIVICDMLISLLTEPKKEFIDFIRKIANNSNIDFCETVVESEKSTGFRNAALINFIKSFKNIHNEIDEVLDFYYNLCSIKMTCKELAQTFLFLANNGKDTIFNTKIINAKSNQTNQCHHANLRVLR